MNVHRRLREEAKKYDCSVCGTNHARSDIRVLGKIESSYLVRVVCSGCQTAFKLIVPDAIAAAVVPVKEERPRASRRPPVTADDVLDAHGLLRDFRGDVSALFTRTPARRDPRRQ